jgi:3'-5' exoribonuclease Rv2179c-like domain
MTKYFYDTEFLEDGETIELISIGILAEDGREYYAVSDACTRGKLEKRIRKHEWLMANVVPSLPKPAGDWNLHMPRKWLFNYHAHEVKSRERIADEVREFLLAGDRPELWADYGAYDHVVLCQLWGPMMSLPDGLPMFTCDIQQEAARLGVAWDELPPQAEGNHNALADARHNRVKFDFLVNRAADSNVR